MDLNRTISTIFNQDYVAKHQSAETKVYQWSGSNYVSSLIPWVLGYLDLLIKKSRFVI
jgi:hypothetical protein